jgi:hypothetical protein
VKRFCRVVILLTLGLWVLSAEKTSAQSASSIDQLLPDNTEMAFHLNVKSLLNSPVFQKHFKEDVEKHLKENARLQNVMTSLGFDPLKDVISVTATISKFIVPGPGQPPDIDVFVVIKGAFNLEKMNAGLGTLIAAANQGDKVSTSTYGDYTIYEYKDGNSKYSIYATILNKETIIASTQKSQLTDGIERGLGKKSGKLTDKFTSLLNKARNQDTFWGAFLMPTSIKDMARMSPNPDAGDVMTKFESQTVSFNLRDSLRFAINMNLTDAATAGKLKEMVDQGKEMAGTLALQNEQIGSELADVVGSLQVGQKDKMVSIQGEVKADFVDKLAKMMKERAR